MKKRLLWILFISALLCLSMLFAACDSGTTNIDTDGASETESVEDGTSETGSETNTVEEIPEDEITDYAAILTEWSTYITAVGMESEFNYQGSGQIQLDTTDSDRTVTMIMHGRIAEITIQYEYNLRNPEDDNLVTTQKEDKYFVNFETGARVLNETLTYGDYSFDHNKYINTYEAQVLLDTIVEVESKVWKNTAEEGEAEIYEWVSTYAYYKRDGQRIAQNLEEPATTVTSGGVNAVIIGDTAYHCKNSDVILETDKNTAHALPSFDPDSITEYGGYTYFFDGNGRIKVVDTGYMVVVDCPVPGYILDNLRFATILSNGDVYFYAQKLCEEGSKDFNVEYEDEKYKVWHLVISLETGEAAEIDAPYMVMTAPISNYNAADYGMKIEGSYQLATVLRIADGKVEPYNYESVILGDNLTEVAILSKLVKDQAQIYIGIESGKLIVRAFGLTGDALYMADTENNTVTRYPANVTALNDGGFILDGKVYNNAVEEIFDLDDVDETWMVYGGNILFTVDETFEVPVPPTEGEGEGENEGEGSDMTEVTKKVTYIGYIDETGKFQKTKLGEDITVTTDLWTVHGLYHVTGTDAETTFIKIFDLNGKQLWSTSDSDEYSNKTVTIYAEYDGSIVIRERISGLTSVDYYHIIK